MSSQSSRLSKSYGTHSHSINRDLEEEEETEHTTLSVTQTLVSSLANSVLKFREKFKGKRTSAYNARRLRSKGALLVLFWNFMVFSYQQAALGSIVKLFNKINSPWQLALTTLFLQDCLPKMLYPIAGWIADAKVGRYKVMRTSMLIMWIGSIGLVFVSLLNYGIAYVGPKKTAVETEYYTLWFVLLVYALNAIGIAGFHTNVIPFGIDQMEDGSAEQYSAFIHWYYWTRNCGLGLLIQLALQSLSVYCDADSPHPGIPREPVAKFDSILLLIQCMFMTTAVCSDFLFSNKVLNKDPKTHYPLLRIWKVSKFVAQNNKLVGQRKAITFTYDAPPSRWDFAKRLYGGPFEEEDVEEVRAFWRIVVVLLSIGLGAWFVINTGFYIYPILASHMKAPRKFPDNAVQCTGYNLLTSFSSPLSFAFLIPIYEFIIYPCFRKYVLRLMKRIGAGMIILLLGLAALVVIDSVGHRNTCTNCMFYNFTTNENESLRIPPGVLAPVIFVMAIGEMLTTISAFEFVCAQSPYSMRGLLIGLLYATVGLFIGLTGLVLLTFSLSFRRLSNTVTHPLSCGTWYLLASILIGLIGIVVYFTAAQWYKKRQRGDQVYNQAALESYYDPLS